MLSGFEKIPITVNGPNNAKSSGGQVFLDLNGAPFKRNQDVILRCIPEREREFFIDNILVQIHLIVEMISVDRFCAIPFFQVALHLLSLILFPISLSALLSLSVAL